jgi:tetratricopeptide (TPR) repeat protein
MMRCFLLRTKSFLHLATTDLDRWYAEPQVLIGLSLSEWDVAALAEVDLGRFAEAEKALTEAAELAPENATVLLHLSRAYSGVGQKDEAHAALERFRALGPDRANHIPPAGVAELLGFPPEQLYAQYRAEVERRFQNEPHNSEVNVRYLKLLR